MKKILALLLAVTLTLTVFVGCKKEDKEPEAAYDVAEILSTIEEASPVRMSTPIDDEYLSYMGLDDTMYEKYAGSYCPITPGVDIILAVQAKQDKVSEVETILTQKRDDIFKANENYVGALKDKAEAGRVVTKGNYVVLVIGGDEVVVEDEGVEKAYEPIDKAIEEAFK